MNGKNRKRIGLLAGLLALCVLGTACASMENETSSQTAAAYTGEGGGATAMDSGETAGSAEMNALAQASGANTTLETGRSIARTAELNVEATDFDGTVQKLSDAVSSVSGYFEQSSRSGSTRRSAYYLCRIPAEQYGAFLKAIDGAGNVISIHEGTEDVTGTVIDIEARLKSLKTQEARLLELMETAGKLSDLIEVQEKLSEVQYEIENYTAQQKAISERVSYASITVYLEEVTTLTPVEPSFGERCAAAFTGMLENIAQGAQDFVVVAIYLLPVLLIAAAVVLVVLLLVRRQNRKRKKAIAEAMQNQPK